MSSRTRHRVLQILGVLTLLAAVPVTADTYIVDRFDDSFLDTCSPATPTDCPLRGAIIAANNHPGDDVVRLGTGTYTLSLTGLDEDFCLLGDLDVRDTLLIVGDGPERTVVDAAGVDRVLHVLAPGHRLTVRGVTITGGQGGPQSGGGFFLSQGSLRLESYVVTANAAPNGQGGGVYDVASNTTDGVQIVDSWINSPPSRPVGVPSASPETSRRDLPQLGEIPRRP